MTFIKSIPFSITVVVVLFLMIISAGFGYIKGIENESDKILQLRIQLSEAELTAKTNALNQKAKYEQVLRDHEKGWVSAIDWHRSHHRIVRVQQPTSSGGCLKPVSELSTTPGELAQSRTSSNESWITFDQCEQLANDSLLDREWIEQVKKLTDGLHEASTND